MTLHPWFPSTKLPPHEHWPIEEYSPIRLLGEGGMAQLYLVESTGPREGSTRQPFALKRLRPHLAREPEARVMFRDEIRLIRCLQHPSIVRYLDAQEDGEVQYLVVEYIEGCNLQMLLHWMMKEQQTLHWTHAYHIALGVATGIAYLHHATDKEQHPLDIVHRDLSPANILLQRDGAVKLTDFGVSMHKLMIRQTWGEDLRGQFAYLAPELLFGQAADQRSDIFSWGVTMWETFAGQRLFDAENPEAILNQVREATIPPLASVSPETPKALCHIIDHALQRERQRRYSSSSLLLHDWKSLQPTEAQTQPTHSLLDLIAALSREPTNSH